MNSAHGKMVWLAMVAAAMTGCAAESADMADDEMDAAGIESVESTSSALGEQSMDPGAFMGQAQYSPPVKQCPPPAKYCPPPVKQCPPPAKYCPPPVKQCPPPAKYCPPPVKQFPPHVKQCPPEHIPSSPIQIPPPELQTGIIQGQQGQLSGSDASLQENPR